MRYDIKAIPTKYAGVQFRSRLEARWAAFFDLIGWVWEYEPFDLNGWAPDFRVVSRKGKVMLVEVKPISSGADQAEILSVFAKCIPQYDAALERKEAIVLLGFELNDRHIGWRLSKNFLKPNSPFSAKEYVPIGVTQDRMWRKAGNTVAYKPKK